MECTGVRFRKNGFEFPCGQCIVCRLRTQRQWIARILLENALHQRSCFLTLTYDEEHVPAGGSVHKRDIQLWLKKLRNEVPPKSIRYLAVGEYGEKNWRPHYHVALFGCDDSDLILRTWGHGHILVRGLGVESAAYIVSYLLKRRNNEERCEGRNPEFKLQSLRPAIGLRTAERLPIPDGKEVSGVRLNGRIYPLGKYIRQKLREQDGPEQAVSVAFRHRLAKFALLERDPEKHKTDVENAETFEKQVLRRRAEKPGL